MTPTIPRPLIAVPRFSRARDFELEGRVHAERNRKALRDMEAMIVEDVR